MSDGLPGIVVTGASGRMGQMLVREITASDKCRLVGCIERPGHAWVGHDIGTMIGGAPLGVLVSDDPLDAFQQWNRCWVTACLEHGALAVHLRSPAGFLQRRDEGDPVISYACDQIEPLLAGLDGDTTLMLFTWNVTSDPREVLDLQRLGWDATRIAEFVTRSVLATPSVD